VQNLPLGGGVEAAAQQLPAGGGEEAAAHQVAGGGGGGEEAAQKRVAVDGGLEADIRQHVQRLQLPLALLFDAAGPHRMLRVAHRDSASEGLARCG
jgi:hypothetical protein